MSTLFISHSSSDNEAAKELSRRLAEPPRNHHSVFLDLDPEQGIVAGQSWERTLYRKLRSCRAVIALITDTYLGSQWCFAEIALARMEGKHIFALLVDPLGDAAKMPGILTEKQFIDLRQDPEDGYRRLWKGLEELDLLGVAGEWDPKQSPYLGLRAYQEKHAAVFFGRGAETRSGIELLDRGSPGLIMVLGSSGSGKSSLVRAGMVPRLRRDTDRWLVVDPFRPQRDPVAEVAESLAAAYRRYAPDEAAREGSKDRIREKLEAGLPRAPVAEAEAAGEGAADEGEPPSAADERLRNLLSQIEELRQSPPEEAGPPVMKFLDWSLDDLRRICGVESPVPSEVAAGPGSSPLVEIADHLRRASGRQDARVLLIVDQFEELLGQGPGGKAHRFLAMLRDALETEHSPLMALGTMRSDFLGLLQRNRALRDVDFESLSVGPMSVDAMRRVIGEPAKLGAIELEPGLADRLLEDTETPDALPLLSFTLWRLWEDRRDGRLSVAQYEALGGLDGAVAREAEAVLESARKQGQEDDVRAAFLQMARLTEDGSYARQPASWEREELQKVKPILQAFEQRRLLVTRQEEGVAAATLEVAHEALFRSWAPLKGWLDDNRSELLLKQQLRRDAKAWEESGRTAETLWRGGRLQQAHELLRRGALGAADAEVGREGEFVRSGIWRRRKQRLALAAIALVIAGTLAWFWKEDRRKKHELADTLAVVHWAEGQRARDAGENVRALHWMAAAAGTAASPALVRNIFIDAWRELERANGMVLLHEARGNEPAVFDQDGSHVLARHADGSARRWDTATGESQVLPSSATQEGPGSSMVLEEGHVLQISEDGTRVLTGDDETAWLWGWDGKTGAPLGVLDINPWEPDSFEFSPDGSRLLYEDEGLSGGPVQLLDSETGDPGGGGTGSEKMRPLAVLPDDISISTTVFCPDGNHLLVWGARGARLWDSETGDPRAARVLGETALEGGVFSDDGRHLLTWEKHAAQLWDGATGQPIGASLPHRGDASIEGALLARSARRLVTWGSDGAVRLWQAGAAEPRPTEMAHPGIQGAVLSGDEGRLLTWGGDVARLWDSETGNQLGAAMAHLQISSASFSPDDSRLLTRGWGVQLWDSATDSQLMAVMVHEGDSVGFAPGGAVFVEGGRRVLTWASEGSARLWDSETGKPTLPAPLRHPDGNEVCGAAFSEREKHILTWDDERTARLWHGETGELIRHAEYEEANESDEPANIAVLVADASRALDWFGTNVWSWDSRTGEVITVTHEGVEKIEGALFSPAGDRMLAWGEGRAAQLWDSRDGNPIATLEHSEGSSVTGAVYSQDGQRLLTWGTDGTARLWKGPDGGPLRTLSHREGAELGAALAGDGGLVLTWDEAGPARLWESSSGKLRTELDGGLDKALFSLDGRRLLTWDSYQDAPVRLWETATGELLRAFAQPSVVEASFAADGSRVLTTGRDVRLWDSASGTQMGPALRNGAGGNVWGAILSEDQSRLLAWGDGTVGLWDVGADLDFPPERLHLAVQVLTSTRLDPVTEKLELLGREEWLELREDYRKLAEQHREGCKYPRSNLARRIFPE